MTKANPIDLHPVQRLLDKHRVHKEEYELEIDGIKLRMVPNVFCPAYTNTSRFLTDNLTINEGESVLDMFSGSGFVGICAARIASRVVCVDHSLNAIKCIKNNIKANNLANKVSSVKSDLFKAIKVERFDVVIANPPLLPGKPRTLLETAVFDPGLKTTVKFFRISGKELFLEAANPAYPPIPFTAKAHEPKILGRVVGLYRSIP